MAGPSPPPSVVALAALAAALLIGAPDAQASRGMEVALSDDGIFVHQSYYGRRRALRRARELGVTRLRVMLEWAGALREQAKRRKPPKRPLYHLADIDDAIDAAAAAGIRVQLTLSGPAPRYATSNGRIGPWRPDPRMWADFVRTMARHFEGRVDRYSIWNEPNYKSWLAPLWKGPALYRRLYVKAYKAIRSVDPDAAILIGETSPHNSPGRATAPLKFLRRAACVNREFHLDRRCAKRSPAPGGPLRADGYAQHPYNFLYPPSHREPGQDNVTIGTVGRLRYTLDHLRSARALVGSRPAMPIYLTEFGYFVSGRRKISEKRQAEWLEKAYKLALRTPRVRQLLQWGLVVKPKGYPGDYFNTAIIDRNGSKRKAFNRLREWAKRAMRRGEIRRPGGPIDLPPARHSPAAGAAAAAR